MPQVRGGVGSFTTCGACSAFLLGILLSPESAIACTYLTGNPLETSNKHVHFAVDIRPESMAPACLMFSAGPAVTPLPVQVFVNGTLVGGSDKLSVKVSDGSFSELLASSSSQQPAPLPQQLQQALEAAAAAAAAKPGGTQSGGPQVPAELQQLVSKLTDVQGGVPRSPQPGQLPAHAFTGQALVDWLMQHNSSSSSSSSSAQGSRAAAVETAGKLLATNVVTVVSEQQPSASGLVFRDEAAAVYRLRAEAPRDLAWGTPLNTGDIDTLSVRA